MNTHDRRLLKLESKIKSRLEVNKKDIEWWNLPGFDLSELSGNTNEERIRTFLDLADQGKPTPDACREFRVVYDSI